MLTGSTVTRLASRPSANYVLLAGHTIVWGDNLVPGEEPTPFNGELVVATLPGNVS